MECMVMPMRNQNQILTDKFCDWFKRGTFLSLEREIFQRAAALRAAHPTLKTPDAIHLAAALHYGCGEFWTNDDRLIAVAPQIAKNVTN
jgi:predicted nucleic acid-binding protein